MIIYNLLVSFLLLQSYAQTNYPDTTLTIYDRHNIGFISHAIFNDPANKYDFVMREINTIPTWLFIMRYKNDLYNEVWRKEEHNGIKCNVVFDNKMLLHLETVGMLKADIIFLVSYSIDHTTNATIITIKMDKTYTSSTMNDFMMTMKVSPHPSIKNLVIVDTNGYINSKKSIGWVPERIKWHIDSMMRNFGDRLMAVIK